MATCNKKGNLYALDGEVVAAFMALGSGKTTEVIWHQRLGHPYNNVEGFNSQRIIDTSSWNKISTICINCH